VVLAMIGLTLLVIAMIASYSGAFAKPTLHHMTVAVAAPEQVVNGVRGQEALAVNEVGDDAAARRQVYERKSDAAFVSPTGEMKIYVAGGGGRSVANAAETVGRAVAAEAGLTPAVEDVAPASAGDPSGTVEFMRSSSSRSARRSGQRCWAASWARSAGRRRWRCAAPRWPGIRPCCQSL